MTEQTIEQKSILIAEDDDQLRASLATALRDIGGYQVIETNNGKDALTKSLSDHPNLIILDVQMPTMLGTDTLGALRQDEWGKDVPVILLTVQSDLESVSEAINIGGPRTSYLTKNDWSLHEVVNQVKKEIGDV